MNAGSNMAALLAVAALGLISQGCSGADSTAPPVVDPPVLTTFQVVPAQLTLQEGFSAPPLQLAGRDQYGAPIRVVGVTTYSGSDTTVAVVDNRGVVTGRSPGATEVFVQVKTGPATTISGATTVTILGVIFDPSATINADTIR